MSNVRIPNLCDSARLAKLAQYEGEPCVVLKAVAIGSTGEHEMLDKEGRVYRLKWSSQHGGHIIRIPFSLWQQNKHRLAHDIMDQPLHLPLIVMVEGDFQSQVGQVVKSSGSYPESAGANPAPATNLESLKAQVAESQEKAAAVIASNEGTVTTADVVAEVVEQPADEPAEEAPIITEMKRILATGSKRVADLAKELKADEQLIRDAIESEGSGLHIGAAGWVKTSAQEG